MTNDMSTDDLVRVEKDGRGCAVVTLNRPAAMNALSRGLMSALAAAIDGLAADAATRVVILTGAGRAFCAGLDLKEIGAGEGSLGRNATIPESAGGTTKVDDPVAAIERFDGPVIGAINGAAVTGGFELALACDVLVASPNARFADTHARIGIAPGWGLSQKLSRTIGPYRAREVSFTGNWIGAEQALSWGLVNHLVAADELMAKARSLANDMLSTDPAMLRRYKSIINDGFSKAYGEGRALELARAREFNATVRADAVESRREGVSERNRQSG